MISLTTGSCPTSINFLTKSKPSWFNPSVLSVSVKSINNSVRSGIGNFVSGGCKAPPKYLTRDVPIKDCCSTFLISSYLDLIMLTNSSVNLWFLAGNVYCAVRWKTVTCFATFAISGMDWIPDEPVPMTPTFLPPNKSSNVIFLGHLLVCNTDPLVKLVLAVW